MGDGEENVVEVPANDDDEIADSKTEKVEKKPRDSKSKGKGSGSSKKSNTAKNAPATKVVIRRLPASMTTEAFLEAISPVPEHDHFYFVAGDKSLEPNSFARAYINFVHAEDVFIFKEKFDGYVFVDAKGNEYPAMVEFAPYQKVPKKRNEKKKPDPKAGTIENDPEYLAFLQEYEKDEKPQSHITMEQRLEEIEAKEKAIEDAKSTPLLEFMKERHEEKRKILDEKRRKKREEKRQEKKKGDKVKKIKEREDDAVKKEPKKIKESSKAPKESAKPSKETNVSSKPPKDDHKEEVTEKKGNKKNTREGKQKDRGGDRPPKRRDESARDKPKDKQQGSSAKPVKDDSKAETELSRSEENMPEKTTKPKRYSDRRQNDKIKREQAKGSSQTPTAVPEIETDFQQMAIKEEEKVKTESAKKSKDDDDLKAKRERERQERKERIKNKERPARELYRPGMSRLNSTKQKPEKEATDEPSAPEEASEQEATRSKKQGGKRGGRGSTRFFYNRDRGNKPGGDRDCDKSSNGQENP